MYCFQYFMLLMTLIRVELGPQILRVCSWNYVTLNDTIYIYFFVIFYHFDWHIPLKEKNKERKRETHKSFWPKPPLKEKKKKKTQEERNTQIIICKLSNSHICEFNVIVKLYYLIVSCCAWKWVGQVSFNLLSSRLSMA